MTFQARVFQVLPNPPNLRPGDKPPKPVELAEEQVDARGLDAAKKTLQAKLTSRGHKVRSINFAPARSGKKGAVELIAYLHPKEK